MNNKLYRIIISLLLSSFTAVYSIEKFDKIVLVAGGVGIILTFIISYYLLGKYDLLEEVKGYKIYTQFKKRFVLIATLLSSFTLVKNSSFLFMKAYEKIIVGGLIEYKIFAIAFSMIALLVILVIGLVNFFILWTLLTKLYFDKIYLFFKKFNTFEKSVLYIYIFSFAVINFIFLLFTNAFVFPLNNGELTYNAVFTLDTGYLIRGADGIDVFSSPSSLENDIRHILFGIIGLPLSMICMPIAYFFAFLFTSFDFSLASWDFYSNTIYGYLISIGQAFLFALSGILIYKILRKEIDEKLSKLFLILYLVSYSTVLFVIAVEQYAITTFTLILFVYIVINKFDSKNAFIVASLSITSSVAMLPFVFKDKKVTVKSIIRPVLYIGAVSLIGIIYFGQLYEMFRVINTLKFLSTFADVESISFMDKLNQFLGFIPSIFIAPDAVFENGVLKADNPSTLYIILGQIILVVSILSMLFNRHKKVIHIAAYWVLISFVILVIVGWGSVERSMILYSSYFGWAFFILIALGFAKLFGDRVLGKFILSAIIISVAFYNATEFVSYVANLGPFR